MKKYEVNMDVTVSLAIEVEAKNKEQAQQIARDKFNREQQLHLSHYHSVLALEVGEVSEAE